MRRDPKKRILAECVAHFTTYHAFALSQTIITLHYKNNVSLSCHPVSTIVKKSLAWTSITDPHGPLNPLRFSLSPHLLSFYTYIICNNNNVIIIIIYIYIAFSSSSQVIHYKEAEHEILISIFMIDHVFFFMLSSINSCIPDIFDLINSIFIFTRVERAFYTRSPFLYASCHWTWDLEITRRKLHVASRKIIIERVNVSFFHKTFQSFKVVCILLLFFFRMDIALLMRTWLTNLYIN